MVLSVTGACLVDVECPDCADPFVVSLAIIEESQRLLEQFGPCTGLASFECPVPYFAALIAPRDVTRINQRAADERELERWESEGGRVHTRG